MQQTYKNSAAGEGDFMFCSGLLHMCCCMK